MAQRVSSVCPHCLRLKIVRTRCEPDLFLQARIVRQMLCQQRQSPRNYLASCCHLCFRAGVNLQCCIIRAREWLALLHRRRIIPILSRAAYYYARLNGTKPNKRKEPLSHNHLLLPRRFNDPLNHIQCRLPLRRVCNVLAKPRVAEV